MEYDISANSIISKLRPKKGFDLLCAPQKSDLMTQILAHDADKVFEFLIEVRKSNSTSGFIEKFDLQLLWKKIRATEFFINSVLF